MQALSRDELAQSLSLDELYSKLEAVGMGAGWNKPTPSLWAAPRRTFQPTHWKYEQAHGALDAAGRLINTELAERRNLILFNPAQGNTYATVRTIVAAYQMIMPAERARVHRHTPNALRLILDAEPGTYTVVDGLRIAMEPGDVVLTPNWSTHGHGNDGNACAYWLDFLDAPLVQLLEPMFFDPHVEDEGHDAFKSDSPATKESPFVFTLGDTLRRLDESHPQPAGPFGTCVQLGNPALETIAVYMMKLVARSRTAPYRTTANNIYAVVAGCGATTVDADRFEWRRGDVIAVPAWRPHFHEASDDALVLRVTDEPVLQRLGFHRTEDQPVVSV